MIYIKFTSKHHPFRREMIANLLIQSQKFPDFQFRTVINTKLTRITSYPIGYGEMLKDLELYRVEVGNIHFYATLNRPVIDFIFKSCIKQIKHESTQC